MKIAFDAKRYYHNHTGLGNYSRTLVDALQRLYPENEYVLYDEKSLARTLSLGRKAAGDGCDIYHGLSNELPFDIHWRDTSGQSGSHLQTPVSVMTIHDVCWRTFPEMYHYFDRRIYDFKYGSSCRRADKIIAISESTKQDVMRFYGIPENRIKVIYQPVGAQYYTLMPAGEADRHIRNAIDRGVLPQSMLDRPYFLQVGAINRRKNLLSVVKAMAPMLAGRSAAERPLLIAVGSGREYEREVRSFIAGHGMSDDVVIVAGINDQTLLQALYRRALCMVYPSFYEGFGLPVVEAQLQECPVITSTVSSLPEAANGTAMLVNPDSVKAISDAMQQMFQDTQTAACIGSEARRMALNTFDHDMLIGKVMNLYNDIL